MDSIPDCASAVNTLGLSTLSGSTRRHSARSSAVPSLSLVGHTALQIQTLEDVYRTVRSLSLDACPYNDIERQAIVGEGETFLVERCSVKGQIVVVKHLKLTSLATDTPTFSARLRAVLLELQIMRHAHIATHPNILSLLAYGWKQERSGILPYILVDYSPHGTLRDFLLRNNHLPIHQKKCLVLDVASGLDALHLTGIIHGDVKLDNTLVFDRGGDPRAGKLAKICDFGHSLLLTGDHHDLKYRGTSIYNAPEVQRQPSSTLPKEFLHKCDVWAFGLLAWEVLLSGKTYRDHLIANPEYASDGDQLGFQSSSLLKFAISSTHDVDDKFHKLFFCGLFRMTLQDRPEARTSYLTANLPVRKAISQKPDSGGLHVLSRPPSLDPGKTTWSSDIFRPEQGKSYSWDHQQSIFQAFKMHSRVKNSDPTFLGSVTWQLGLCYLSGFGTPLDYNQGFEFVGMSEDYAHPVASIFGSSLRNQLEQGNRRQTYVDNVSFAFRAQLQYLGDCQLILDFETPSSNRFSDYSSIISWLRTAYPLKDKSKTTELGLLLSSRVTISGATPKSMSILEMGIARGDHALIRDFCTPEILRDNSFLGSLLVQACRLGESAIVECLLTAGADVNYVTSDGTTFFHWLFMLADKSMPSVKAKMSHETLKAIELPCRKIHLFHSQWPLRLQGTPLAFSVSVGNMAAVQLLLELGASPFTPAFGSIIDDFDERYGWTAIHLAAQHYDAEMLKLLLESVSSRKAPSYDSIMHALSYYSPIEGLAFHGQHCREALQETIFALRKVKRWSRLKRSPVPLVEAIHCHDESVVRSLLKQSPKLVRRPISQNNESLDFVYAVHLAVQEAVLRDSPSSYAVLAAIVDADHNALRERDSNGCTPLHFAVRGYSDRASSWLLAHEPSLLTLLDHEGRSALHYCASPRSTKLLLSRGASLNLPDVKGMTPIHCVAEFGAAQALQQLLVFHEPDVNAKDKTRSTPLHCAASRGHFEATKCLLAFGASVDEQDQDGNTPLHLAVRHGCEDVFRLLIDHGTRLAFVKNRQGQVPCHVAVLQGNPTAITLLAATATIKDANGSSPLHLCALSGKGEWMSQLLSHCSPLEASDGNIGGQTPLHMAAQVLAVDVTNLLLKKGLSACVKDLQGDSALHVALNAPESPNLTALCTTLHAAGASLTERNSAGFTPWEVAIQRKNSSIMEFLANNGGVAACPGLIFTDALLQAALGEKEVDKMSAIYGNGTVIVLEQCHRRLISRHVVQEADDNLQEFFKLGVQDDDKHVFIQNHDADSNTERGQRSHVPAFGSVGRIWEKTSRFTHLRTAHDASQGKLPEYSFVDNFALQKQRKIEKTLERKIMVYDALQFGAKIGFGLLTLPRSTFRFVTSSTTRTWRKLRKLDPSRVTWRNLFKGNLSPETWKNLWKSKLGPEIRRRSQKLNSSLKTWIRLRKADFNSKKRKLRGTRKKLRNLSPVIWIQRILRKFASRIQRKLWELQPRFELDGVDACVYELLVHDSCGHELPGVEAVSYELPGDFRPVLPQCISQNHGSGAILERDDSDPTHSNENILDPQSQRKGQSSLQIQVEDTTAFDFESSSRALSGPSSSVLECPDLFLLELAPERESENGKHASPISETSEKLQLQKEPMQSIEAASTSTSGKAPSSQGSTADLSALMQSNFPLTMGPLSSTSMSTLSDIERDSDGAGCISDNIAFSNIPWSPIGRPKSPRQQ